MKGVLNFPKQPTLIRGRRRSRLPEFTLVGSSALACSEMPNYLSEPQFWMSGLVVAVLETNHSGFLRCFGGCWLPSCHSNQKGFMQMCFRSSRMVKCRVGRPSRASGFPSLPFPCYQSFGYRISWFVEDFAQQKGAGVAPHRRLVFVRQRKALCPAQAKAAEEMQSF